MKIRYTVRSRIFTLLLALLLTVGGLLPAAAVPASAAGNLRTYDSLNVIPENIEIFKTIAKGRISAVCVKGTWYYQFERKGYDTVRIECDAFAGAATNGHLAYDNQKLNCQLAKNSNTNYEQICYYNATSIQNRGTYKTCTTSMYRLLLKVQAGGTTTFKAGVTVYNAIEFTYATKVRADQDGQVIRNTGRKSANADIYVTPTTAKGYLAALKRSTDVNAITPEITVQIDNHQKGTAFLSTYSLSGKGNADTGANVNDCIAVVSSTAKALRTAATGDYVSGFVSLVSVVGNARTMLTKTSSEYNTGESIALTREDSYIISTKLVSPIDLSQAGDCIQYQLDLGGRRNEVKDGKTSQLSSFVIDFSFR